LPAVQAAREAARRIQCSNNMVQLILAVQNYEMAFERLPSGSVDAQGPILNRPLGFHHSWIIPILPYLERTNYYRNIDHGLSVYDPKNAPVRRLQIAVLRCPSDGWMADTPRSSYVGVHHDLTAPIDVTNNGVFYLNSNVRYRDLIDGSSLTLFLGEKTIEESLSAFDLGWMSGTPGTLRNTGSPINGGLLPIVLPAGVPTATRELPGLPDENGQTPQGGANDPPAPGDPAPTGPQLANLTATGGFGSRHPSGAHFAMGDGSVRFLGASTNLAVLQQLAHRNDGKLLDESEVW
jgi:prepilin-type processing-associated H-X9-DG protein